MDLSEPLRFICGRVTNYELPDMSNGIPIIPVSGGSDSTFLAILLHTLFPDVPWRMVFTDTGTLENPAEEPEIHEYLDRLERFVGRKVERLIPAQGLHEKIVTFHGYLPSSQSRWCTRELKKNPFSKWLKQFEGIDKFVFVGIRADEPGRVAFSLEQTETIMPFREMGLVREDIFEGMRRTVGIPRFYARRTRSGCTLCPFQRRAELVSLLLDNRLAFLKGERYETVADADLQRWDEGPSLTMDSGIARNWQSFPRPGGGTIEGRKASREPDLFGARIYVCGEFFMDGLLSNDEFCWKQSIVSVAPTLHHIKRQLDARYQHLLATAEVYEMTPDDVRNKVKFAIWVVELPSSVFDPTGPRSKGYTWSDGWAFKQLRHVVSWVTRALNAEAMRQEALKNVRNECLIQAEWRDAAKEGLDSAKYELGQIVASQWYKPVEILVAAASDEEELQYLPCPMCTL